MSEVPKTTVRFSGLLEGLNRIQKLLHSTVHGKRTQIRIGKGKRRMGQSPRGTMYKLPGVQQRHTELSLILPSVIHDSMCKVLPAREAHRVLGIQDGMLTPVIHLSYSDPSPPEVKLIQGGPKPQATKAGVYHKSLVSINYLAWLRTYKNIVILVSTGIPRP